MVLSLIYYKVHKKLTLTYLIDSFNIKVNSCTAIKFECIWIVELSKNLTRCNLIWKFLESNVPRVAPLFLDFLLLIGLSDLLVVKSARKEKLEVVKQLYDIIEEITYW